MSRPEVDFQPRLPSGPLQQRAQDLIETRSRSRGGLVWLSPLSLSFLPLSSPHVFLVSYSFTHKKRCRMRPHGKIKLGYFPLPIAEAESFRKCVTFASEFSAVDPSLGDHAAFPHFARRNSGPPIRY